MGQLLCVFGVKYLRLLWLTCFPTVSFRMDENGNNGYVYITINAVSGLINVDNKCHANYNLSNLTAST